ncbi:trigger factor [candidate division NPL-UPA2 bacterium]|nr:trigger factor [candidate division NPL-UPA2 bacterium]
MKVEVEKLSEGKQLLKIEVPPKEVDRQFEAAYKELGEKTRVDGFRPGRVPPPILRMHFSKLAPTEALKKIVNWSYPEAVKQLNITPIADPDIDVGDTLPEEGKPFSFKVKVEARPEVRVEGYKGLSVEKEKIEISDEDVDRVLEMEREENASFLPVEGRPVRENDWVIVDFKSFLNETSFQNAEGYLFQLGSNVFPEEVEKGLIGCQVGEEREMEVTRKSAAHTAEGSAVGSHRQCRRQPEASEGAPSEEKVLYQIKLKGIKERRLVIVDDEFARDLGNFSSLAELREDIRKRLEQRARKEEERRLREKIVNTLAERMEVEVPPSLVEGQIEYLMAASKLEPGGNEAEASQLREKLRPLALKMIKEAFILEGIARQERIEASPEEIEEEARVEPRSMTKGREAPLTEDRRRALAYRIRNRKAVDFLVSQAKIKEKEKSLILTPDQVRMLRPRRKRLLEPGERRIIIT